MAQPAAALRWAWAPVAPYLAAIIAIYSLMSKGGETRTGGQYGMRDGKVAWLEGPSGGDPNAVSTIRAIETAQQQIYSLVGTLGGTGGGTITRAGYENSEIPRSPIQRDFRQRRRPALLR